MSIPLLVFLGVLLAIPVGIILVMYLIVPLFKGIGWVIRHLFQFIAGELGDVLRIIGAVVTQIILVPLVVANVLIGRWSAAAHFGRALKAEFKTTFTCIYRIAIGHPARLLGLTALTDGIERRLPEVMAAAPAADRPSSKTTGQFEGYTIVGSLPGGGSGGKLYVAQPDAIKLAVFARQGRSDVRQVVIKTFSLKDGSSLPQIVRESRALEAAKKLGLVLEHELGDDRFYYVTEYVPGESLGLVTQRLHAMSGGDGLSGNHLRSALSYSADLLRTLDTYHRGGLWHKDVKPDNIIVDGRAAHLVDFGLVTPLRSGMTLTTHGTEYFRDPEMVRLALKGVKVHQVDGARFDVYAAGAVLFSMIENSFPAHGGLSQITRRCPEALRWIVRRAMADYDKRYTSAAAMLADLDTVRLAADPSAVMPAELPSMRGQEFAAPIHDDAPIRPAVHAEPVGAGSGRHADPFVAAAAGSPAPRRRPKIEVNRWWSGGYVVAGVNLGVSENVHNAVADAVSHAQQAAKSALAAVGLAGFGGKQREVGGGGGAAPTPRPWAPRVNNRTAQEQVAHARERVKAARDRARARMQGRRRSAPSDFRVMNFGVVAAAALFLVICVGVVFSMFSLRRQVTSPDAPPTPMFNPVVPFAAIELSDSAAGGLVLPAANNGTGPRILVNGEVVGESIPASVPIPVTEHSPRVLVLSDIVPMTPGMATAVSRLRDSGFAVVGNYPGSESPGEELVVEARAIRNLAPLTTPDTTTALSEWLADREDVNLLVWFSKPDPSSPIVQTYLFSGSTQAPDRQVLETAVKALGRR